MDYRVEDCEIEGLLIEVEKQPENADEIKKKTAAMFIGIRAQAGMNRKEFAEWLGIPYRTMQDWELGVSQVPDYVMRLIAYKVRMEKEMGRL